MNKLDLPDNAELAKQMVEANAQDTITRREMGLLGGFFGGKYAPNNIAGLIVVASFVALVVFLMWGVDAPTLTKKDVLTILGGFITLGLGFIFGRVSQ